MSEVLVLSPKRDRGFVSAARAFFDAIPRSVRIVGVLLLMAGLTAGIILAPVDYRAMGNYGYLGVFVVTLLATAALVFPVPYIGLIVVAGSFLNPVLVALVAGLAAAIGEMTGYVLGLTGRALLPEKRWVAWVERSLARYGIPIVFVAAVVPNPLFDAVGLIAGTTRLPVWKFLVPCFVGKSIRFWLIASFGLFLPAAGEASTAYVSMLISGLGGLFAG